MTQNTKLFWMLFTLGCVVCLTSISVVSYRYPVQKSRSLEERRNDHLMTRLGRAYSDIEKGRFAEAEKNLLTILQERPEHTIARRLQGLLYYRTERYDEAEMIYRNMLESNEFDASAYNNLGQVLFRKKQYPEALEMLLRSKELNPHAPSVHVNLSSVYAALGKADLAQQAFQEAQRLFHADGLQLQTVPGGEQ